MVSIVYGFEKLEVIYLWWRLFDVSFSFLGPGYYAGEMSA